MELERTIGKEDLDLKSVIREIVGDQKKWDGFQKFCEGVMRKKEEDERIRRGRLI